MTTETKLLGYRKILSCTTCFRSHEVTDIRLDESYSIWNHFLSEEPGGYFGLWFDIPWSEVHAIYFEGRRIGCQEKQLDEDDAKQKVLDHVAEHPIESTFQGTTSARNYQEPYLKGITPGDHIRSVRCQLLSAMEVRV